MLMITKVDVEELGFGKNQAIQIIRRAKKLMVDQGYPYYDNRRLGCVPVEAVEAIIGTKQVSAQKNSSMTYQEFFETYFVPDYQRTVSPTTFDNRMSTMRVHFARFYNHELKDISAPQMKQWQNDMAVVSAISSIRVIFGLFQQSLDLAVKLGLLESNVAKQAGNVKKSKQTVDFWTKAEFKKVISTLDLSDYHQHFSFIMIWLFFMTGLRLGEAQALEWSTDVDLDKRLLRVNKSMCYKNVNDFFTKPPKTKAGNRLITLDGDTVTYLERWQQVQKETAPSAWLLSRNGLPLSKTQAHAITTRYAKLAKVKRITVHALRHSHASLLISLGENAIVVRDRLGHEDIETTLGIYGHLYPRANEASAKRLTGIIKL